MTRRFPLPLIVCALAALSPLSAQEASDAGTGKSDSKKIELRLLAVDLLAGAAEVVILSGEGQSKPIALPSANLSDPVPITNRKVTLALPASDGQERGRTVAQVQLPQAGHRFLLLMVPVKDTYHCLVVRLDDPNFKAGHVCFFNLSKVSIAGELGKRKFRVDPGKLTFAAPPPQRDLPYYQVRFFYKIGDMARPISDTRWPYDKRNRSYIIFFAKGQRITYRAIDEPVKAKR